MSDEVHLKSSAQDIELVSYFQARAYGVRFAPMSGIDLVWGQHHVSWTWGVHAFFARLEFQTNWWWWGLSVQIQRFREENPKWIWHVGPFFIQHKWKEQLDRDQGSYRATKVR